ncbi:MAG: four helix bundle protein [Deltaproteobacteria bacterium]|nr:four helix bundle protein [Deltaproteobacteria bacterium]
MAQYEHLPVFKAIYDFNIYFHTLSRGFPKDVRYGLAGEVRTLASYVMNQVVLANTAAAKGPHLVRAETSLELMKIKVRMLRDLKAMKVSSYKYASSTLIDISKQIAAWKTWSENGRSKGRQT